MHNNDMRPALADSALLQRVLSSLHGARPRPPAAPGKPAKRRNLQVAASVGSGTGGKKVEKVVLAYSGGLDTSVILRWLQETYDCEVVTFTADLGQVSGSTVLWIMPQKDCMMLHACVMLIQF